MKVIFAPAVSIVVSTTLQRYDGRFCRAPIPLVNVGTSERHIWSREWQKISQICQIEGHVFRIWWPITHPSATTSHHILRIYLALTWNPMPNIR